MGHLDISFLSFINRDSDLAEVSSSLDQLKKHSIAVHPWPEYDYKPCVTFSIAHTTDCILLKYQVQEQSIRATYIKTNDPVHHDSCVEFFVAFNSDAAYYNLEFNCIGTCMIAYGVDRANRNFLPDALCNKIRRRANINTAIDKDTRCFNWDLTLIIPFEVFSYHQFDTLKGMQGRANFFKCGDALPEPHFLAWNPITAPSPDFHLPQYFGKVSFS